MGYTTDFTGDFKLNKPLTPAHLQYLQQFAGTRRMKRNADITSTFPDPIREAVSLPVGIDGGYFVGAPDDHGQYRSDDVTNYNAAPAGQPGLWCQWTPSDDGTAIQWDGGEKFYHYVEWLTYIIDNFLVLWGYVVNGEVIWEGEDHSDMGKIIVEDNQVIVKTGKVSYS